MNCERNKEWIIEGLAAEGPDVELMEQLVLFGQFIGDWNIRARYPQADGTDIFRTGEVSFRWILSGKAIQDVWSIHLEDGSITPVGTTVRFYDPTIEAWRSTWISPSQGIVQRFVARRNGDEIVLECVDGDRLSERWLFYDIRSDAFSWRSETTGDGGRTWLLTEEMQIQRRIAL
jgi:hypothetical protein